MPGLLGVADRRTLRRTLICSTALITGSAVAAMAGSPIELGIGGYYTYYAVAGGIDATYATNGSFTGYKGFAFIQEGELHFTGQTKLDNGTTIGLNVELEAWNPGTFPTGNSAQIDEAFLYAFGGWGRIELGSRDAASYRMYYGTPSALIGWGAIQHNHDWANRSVFTFNKAYGRSMATTITPIWQDVNRINYFTPRLAGLQIGAGYAPKLAAQGLPGVLGGPGAGGFALPPGDYQCGFGLAMNPNNCPTADYLWQDAVDIGFNYLGSFGNFQVALYAAYAYATLVPGYMPLNASANMIIGNNVASWKQWVIGAQVAYGDFTIGGAIGWDNNGAGANYFTSVDNDTRFYTAGIMYENGPWQFSFMWAGFRNTNGNGSPTVTSIAPGSQAITINAMSMGGVPGINSTAFAGGGPAVAGGMAFGRESIDKFEFGANYVLGAGVKLVGGFMYYAASGPSNAVTGNSWAILLGMDLRF